MRKWMLKAVVQKGISYLPGRHRINYFFQKHITGGVRLTPQYFEDRLEHLYRHAAYGEHHGVGLAGARVLELGTGWYPLAPIGFFLAGAEAVTTVDINPLLRREHALETMRWFARYARENQLDPDFPIQPEGLARLEAMLLTDAGVDLPELLGRLRIRYLVGDAQALPFPDGSFDFICSNNTFEHIEPAVLRAILREFRRLLRPGGAMCHFIDMSDHFAHLDPGIGIYNFLRYSSAAWHWIDNALQPQNRWRLIHYRKLYRELDIPIVETFCRPGDLSALEKIVLAHEFRHIPKEELAISHAYIVSKIP
jgi:SAM-dependent methyltransferase